MTGSLRDSGARWLLLAFGLAAGIPSVSAGSLDLNAAAGLNYERVILHPQATGAADDAKLTLVATDPLTGAQTAADLPIGVGQQPFEGLTAAQSLVLDGYAVAADGVTTNAVAHELFVMGRVHTNDNWLCETAETYEQGTGTGVWSGREFAHAEGDRICIDTTSGKTASTCVLCTVGPVPTPRRGYTISTVATFPHAYEELPDPTGQRLGLTVGGTDRDHPNLANFFYVDGGAWRKVPVSVCDPLASTNWQVHISVDCGAGIASYYVRSSDDRPWTILGTASGTGSDSTTEAEFRGDGAIAGLKGNGFDAQLVHVDVEFSAANLHPGVNFEETVVTGRVVSTIIHPTDRFGGTYQVRLTDLDGNVVTTEDYAFTAEGTMEFHVRASELTAGASYRAEVVFHSEAEVEPGAAGLSREAVMARALTNEFWGTNGLWVCETARTYDGLDRGTGEWTGRDCAWTTQNWIFVDTDAGEAVPALDARVSFLPTNELEEAESGYVASIRTVFVRATSDPGETNALFGFTVAATDDGLAFMCLSNKVWQVVPDPDLVPVLGVEYTLLAYVRTGLGVLDYFVKRPSEDPRRLMTVDLAGAEDGALFRRVDISGSGYVTDLSGAPYSTDLLRIHANFDEDALYPGTNFTATTANGIIRFEQLWETDHTNGQLRVVVRDKFGMIVGQRRISFHDLSDHPFQYYVQGLEPGETYSVEVVAEVKNVDSDAAATVGSMARTVTNGVWATDGWIRENVETFSGREIGSGVWDVGEGLAGEEDDFIRIRTTDVEDPDACVSFLATNELPSNTGFEIRTSVIFDHARAELPTVSGEFGVTILDTDMSETGSDESCRFVVISNGVWTTLGPDVAIPSPGVEYELTIRVDRKKGQACYLVRPRSDDGVPLVLANIELDHPLAEIPYQTDFYGLGRLRAHEGDGFDVSLVEVSAEVDPAALTPGTNFASTVAAGVLRIRQIWATDKTSGTYTIFVRDARGRLVASKTTGYRDLVDHDFRVPFEGLDAGEAYDVEIVADLDGEVVTSNRVVAVMARAVGGWIREDAATFAGEEPGTGLWLETNETAYVVETPEGRAIRIEASAADPLVTFDPTNDTPSVRSSTLREIRVDLDFRDVGWYSAENPPTAPSNVLAAVTVWSNDDVAETEADREVALAVITTNGTWAVLDETRRSALLEGRCAVNMLIDLKAGYVRYELVTPTSTNRVHQYDFAEPGLRKLQVSFTGSGFVHSLDGDVWDPNLILGGTNEYADLDSAIRETAGQDETLSPLWWADQLVTVGRGRFTVDDPGNWLRVRFPSWYYFEITTNGSVKVYRFNQSNNWIDYAEDGDENVEITGSGSGRIFLVKTPEGLSWIAALATNEWVSGRIELAGDIDLAKHIWTPIAGFSGTFDGNGRTIRGLNNVTRHAGVPGGEYLYGPTNAWGRSTYGLFGTATNATLSDVTFGGVAITNLADSVAALVGALAGNCEVSRVTVEDGTVFGAGGTVAGLAGFADFDDRLTVVNNTNRAAVVSESALYGEGRWGAGILCVAGPTNVLPAYGTVVVTNNVNEGVVSGTLYDIGLTGGNFAEILAGTTLGAHFGEVHLTNNLARGALDVLPLIRSKDNALEVTNFPAANLAPAFWGYDANGTFLTSLDANRTGAVAVDPVRRTARMLSGMFPNGTENAVGLLNDEITASLPNSIVTMTANLDSWGPIVLDRDLTFDLGTRTIYTVYVNNTFAISNGVVATVRNGTIAVGPESKPFAGDLSHLTKENLTIDDIPEDFYERTTFEVNGEPISVLYATYLAEVINASGTVITLYEGADVEIDVDAGALKVDGRIVAHLADCYGFHATTGEDGSVSFEVRIADSAAPTAEFTMTGGDSGTVCVKVGNAKPGFWYALQHKDSLAAEWVTPPPAEWVRADADGVILESLTDGNQGYYRVMMSDVQGGTPAW